MVLSCSPSRYHAHCAATWPVQTKLITVTPLSLTQHTRKVAHGAELLAVSVQRPLHRPLVL